jgi:hypothetical protein
MHACMQGLPFFAELFCAVEAGKRTLPPPLDWEMKSWGGDWAGAIDRVFQLYIPAIGGVSGGETQGTVRVDSDGARCEARQCKAIE